MEDFVTPSCRSCIRCVVSYLLITVALQGVKSVSVIVNVDPNKEVSDLTHFWKSTGFCPPLPHNESASWFLSEDMTQNIIYIGALPYTGIQNVRIHFLLEAVTIVRVQNGQPQYNFEKLDDLIQNLWSNGLKPGFEIMGNPSGYFTNFEDPAQVHEWRRLVAMLAKRYISQYGLAYIEVWNFESWNEPKTRAFDTLKMTIPGFLNYYDACDAGLRDANPSLKLGAPGGELKGNMNPSSYSWELLNHIVHGKNFFTGQAGGRLDFISIHKKGEEPDNTAAIFAKEETTLTLIKQHLPQLNGKPIYNDEADPLVTWSRDLWWRQDATYAATVVKVTKEHDATFKVIVSHQKLWLSTPTPQVNYQLLSNDNGFLSYNPDFFSQRTLLARFQMNHTDPPHVQMIRKPVYTVMGLLAFLGETQVQSSVQDTPQIHGKYKDLDILATVHHPSASSRGDSWRLSTILYYSQDSHNTTGNADITLDMSALKNASNYTDWRYVVYQLDNSHGNPYDVWQNVGKPKTPNWQQFQDMRANEEPVRVVAPTSIDLRQDEKLHLELSLPGVILINICAQPQLPPSQVGSLSIHRITAGQILLYWDDSCVHSKCLSTYVIEFCPTTRAGPFIRINKQDSVYNSYVYAPDPRNRNPGEPLDAPLHGFYRVKAVDYWAREGEYSPLVQY